jgi:hypothetical protein
VDAGSRQENASKQRSNRAFSSEVDAGSRQENASKQRNRASVPIQSERKGSSRFEWLDFRQFLTILSQRHGESRPIPWLTDIVIVRKAA